MSKKNNIYRPSYHLYLINLKKHKKNEKNKLFKYMLKNKVILQYHYISIFNFKSFVGKYIGDKAMTYYNSTISLTIYYVLSEKDQNLIINLLKKSFNT